MLKFLLAIVLVLLFVAGAIAGLLAAFGWPGLLGLIVVIPAALWAFKVLLAHQCTRLVTTPFRMKGAVLRGAEATVHTVTPAPPPSVDIYTDTEESLADTDIVDTLEADEIAAEREEYVSQHLAADARRAWYYVDVTIRPVPPSPDAKGFLSWDPMDLTLTHPDAKPESIEDGDDDLCVIPEVQIQRDGQWEQLDDNCAGDQRIRLHVGVEPGHRQLRFRYYFEIFGTLTLPPPPTQTKSANG